MLIRVDAPSRSPRVTDEDRVFDDAPLDEPIHPTTLGNMRSLGARRLFAAVVAPSGGEATGLASAHGQYGNNNTAGEIR